MKLGLAGVSKTIMFWHLCSSRHIVLELYRSAFDDPSQANSNMEVPGFSGQLNEDDTAIQLEKLSESPPHRYLFYCYLYQYHLIFLAGDVIEMVCTLLASDPDWNETIPFHQAGSNSPTGRRTSLAKVLVVDSCGECFSVEQQLGCGTGSPDRWWRSRHLNSFRSSNTDWPSDPRYYSRLGSGAAQ